MKNVLTPALLASAAIVSASPAGNTVVQNRNYAALQTSAYTFYFDKFDASVGTLIGVKFEILSAWADGSVVLTTQNYGNGGITFNSFTSDIYAYGPGGSIDGSTSAKNITFSNATLPNSQVKNTTVNYLVDASQDIANGGQAFTVSNTDFFNYIGSGSLGIDVNLDAAASVTANIGRDPIKDFNGYMADTSVRLTYTYTPVPEASTYGIALGGLALAAVAIRRRKQAK